MPGSLLSFAFCPFLPNQLRQVFLPSPPFGQWLLIIVSPPAKVDCCVFVICKLAWILLLHIFSGCPFPWLSFSLADLCKVHCCLFAVGTNVCSCCFVVLGHIEILLFLFLLWVQRHMSCFSFYHAAQVDWCFLFCTLGWQLIAFSISCFSSHLLQGKTVVLIVVFCFCPDMPIAPMPYRIIAVSVLALFPAPTDADFLMPCCTDWLLLWCYGQKVCSFNVCAIHNIVYASNLCSSFFLFFTYSIFPFPVARRKGMPDVP